MSTLEIKNLHAQVLPNEEDGEPKEILKGVNLTIKSGETHAVMGPNGSGKSTLSYVIAGHPKYEVTEGEVLLDGENLLEMEVDERARAGLFLAMQYPTEVPGVKMAQFMRSAVTAVRGEAPKLREWNKELTDAREKLSIDKSFAHRSVNEGFSGGEKKRHEVMQLDLLKPKFAVMDETDSGLDVDALRVVSEGINRYQEETNGGILLITHYKRILNYVTPDFVHVFADGHVIKTGGAELADQLEADGYDQFLK
ncbi:Fe-S cluster assembly ATPase SufC [Corynebacterium sp. YSMAA1_1_D6]|uniref:Fe-S cluster assembly ATPase SufC n=1 Tax=unclassified Corynebacterium TaxID=2624378 RepID=UPI0025DB55DC|nr:Fe-S cluster assembly ATPase SufC [Corynebacterium sp.]